jgi:hypothetical protein
MLATSRAKLAELEALRVVPLVLAGVIVSLLAIGASHTNDDPVVFSHRYLPISRLPL